MQRDTSSGLFESDVVKKFFNLKIHAPVYHYTSKEKAESILTTQQIWLTKFDQSNDSKELRHGIELAVSFLKGEMRKDPYLKVFLEKFLPFLKNETRNPKVAFVMTCFSRSRKSRYLWKKYAGNEAGRCIEFNFDELEVSAAPLVQFRPIFYSRVKLRKLVRKIVGEYALEVRKSISGWKTGQKYDQNMSDIMISILRDVFLWRRISSVGSLDLNGSIGC